MNKHRSSQPPKLLDQVRERLRVKHYSIRTEQVYVDWIKRFIWFHDKCHPKDMGAHVRNMSIHRDTLLAAQGWVNEMNPNNNGDGHVQAPR